MMKLSTLLLPALLFFGCVSNHTTPHSNAKDIIELSTEEGLKLLSESDQTQYLKTKEFWEAQRKNYCGPCSVAVSANTLHQKKTITQDNFFERGVSKAVIKPEIVAKMGLTLREIHAATEHLLPTFRNRKFYAHLSGLDLFRTHLRELNKRKGFQLIVNFSRQSIAGAGMRSGHFSPAVAYNENTRQVLILEVQSSRDSFWVSDKDLYTAMQAIDPVSRIPRGWLKITKEKDQ